MKFYTFLISLLFSISPFISEGYGSERSLNNLHWQFRKKGDLFWRYATVPGTVHTDLLANQFIPDPYFGNNEKQLQWNTWPISLFQNWS
jgi:beta-mannosidase